MTRSKRARPPILEFLENMYEKFRSKVEPQYPYDRKTGVICLPKEIDDQLRSLLDVAKKPEAIKLVATLTGAGLRISKDYVDRFCNPSIH